MADQNTALATTATTPRPGIIARFGERYDVDPNKVMGIVAQTIFKQSQSEPPLTHEETAAALIVCNAYQLNPFTKEIYAFRSKGKLLIVVGVDGWSAIVNRQPQLNGVEFEEHFNDKGSIEAVTCKIHHKDRAIPTVVTEYTHECKRNTDPWNNMPIRMTRNRAFVQCARIAFSITGIIDTDEAQTIEGAPEFNGPQIEATATRTEAVKAVIQHRKAKQTAASAEPEPATTMRQVEESAQEAAFEKKQEAVQTQIEDQPAAQDGLW